MCGCDIGYVCQACRDLEQIRDPENDDRLREEIDRYERDRAEVSWSVRGWPLMAALRDDDKGNVTPFPKSVQLARGERRYPRKVASAKQWQALSAAKGGPCRICSARSPGFMQLHHLVSRQDFGDDIADNLVPVCADCHDAITRRVPTICRLLLTRLSDAEYAYVVTRAGEDYFERGYGLTYERGGAALREENE